MQEGGQIRQCEGKESIGGEKIEKIRINTIASLMRSAVS
jgi:hypothetical protein